MSTAETVLAAPTPQFVSNNQDNLKAFSGHELDGAGPAFTGPSSESAPESLLEIFNSDTTGALPELSSIERVAHDGIGNFTYRAVRKNDGLSVVVKYYQLHFANYKSMELQAGRWVSYIPLVWALCVLLLLLIGSETENVLGECNRTMNTQHSPMFPET